MVDVRVSGPVFDGRADAAVRDFCDEAERDIAGQAYSEVMTNLNQSIKNPTPNYETQITVTQRGADQVVHDRGIVYGPWLETGAGRRTRFRGYHSFARARAAIETKAPAIVQRALRRALGRMG